MLTLDRITYRTSTVAITRVCTEYKEVFVASKSISVFSKLMYFVPFVFS